MICALSSAACIYCVPYSLVMSHIHSFCSVNQTRFEFTDSSAVPALVCDHEPCVFAGGTPLGLVLYSTEMFAFLCKSAFSCLHIVGTQVLSDCEEAGGLKAPSRP
jgi:hypothetical protein